ncbi:hypothetical protein SOVF_091620 [Spinacia oleracea]|nr:hypothetical protein SOVF_091620 [Spinacia oleracea]
MDEVTFRLLNYAPSLKSLIVEIQLWGLKRNLKFVPEHLPCLESVDIHQFCGEEDEIDVLSYILKAAPAFEVGENWNYG